MSNCQNQLSKSRTAGGVLVGGLSKFMLFGGAGVHTLDGRDGGRFSKIPIILESKIHEVLGILEHQYRARLRVCPAIIGGHTRAGGHVLRLPRGRHRAGLSRPRVSDGDLLSLLSLLD